MAASAAATPARPNEAAEIVADLYQAYADRLARYCRGQLGSAQEAEDAVQTTFVHAVQALRNGVEPECEAAWLYTIAKHVCHSVRGSALERTLHTTDVELEAVQTPDRTQDDLSEGICSALATLPERQRRALVLREWRGLSSREVAARLGMGTSETYALLTRARRSMASALTVTTGRTTVAVNLGSLLLKLRALLFGGAAKTATTAAVAVAVAVGGTAAVERAGSGRSEGDGSAVAAVGAGSVARVPDWLAPRPHGRSASTPPPAPAATTRRRAAPGPAVETTTTSGASTGVPTPAVESPSSTGGTTAASPTAPSSPPAGSKPTVAASTPEVQVAGRRVPLADVVPPQVAEALAPIIDTVDAVVPPEVTDVVPEVTDVVAAVDEVVPPLPDLLSPPSQPAPPLLP